MKRNRDLEARLVEWGKEYGGSRYEHLGGGDSWLASIIKWKGRAPQGLGQVQLNTAADQVQEAVAALEAQESGYVPAMTLRAEYLTPGQPIEMKLQRLRKIGENIARVRYYQHLRLARVHVAAWLRLPLEEAEIEICAEEY